MAEIPTSEPEQLTPPEQNRRNLHRALRFLRTVREVLFHPQRLWLELTTWPVVSFLFALIVGIGVGVLSMTPPLYWFAKVSFFCAAIIALAKIAHWLSTSQKGGKVERLVIAFVLFGTVGSGLVWTWTWINQHQTAPNVGGVEHPPTPSPIEKAFPNPTPVVVVTAPLPQQESEGQRVPKKDDQLEIDETESILHGKKKEQHPNDPK